MIIQTFFYSSRPVNWNVRMQCGLATFCGLEAAGNLYGMGSRAEASPAKDHPSIPTRKQCTPTWEAAGGSSATRPSKISIEIR